MLLTSKYDGRCKSCGGRYAVGDQIAWDPQTRKAYHPGCAPLGVADPPRRARGQPAVPGTVGTRDRAQNAALTVLAALEEAILLRADQLVSADLERAWDRYQKVKALALQPGTEGEGQAALRTALIEAIKIAF